MEGQEAVEGAGTAWKSVKRSGIVFVGPPNPVILKHKWSALICAEEDLNKISLC